MQPTRSCITLYLQNTFKEIMKMCICGERNCPNCGQYANIILVVKLVCADIHNTPKCLYVLQPITQQTIKLVTNTVITNYQNSCQYHKNKPIVNILLLVTGDTLTHLGGGYCNNTLGTQGASSIHIYHWLLKVTQGLVHQHWVHWYISLSASQVYLWEKCSRNYIFAN